MDCPPDDSPQKRHALNLDTVDGSGNSDFLALLCRNAEIISAKYHSDYPHIPFNSFYSLAMEVLNDALSLMDKDAEKGQKINFFYNRLKWRLSDYVRSNDRRVARHKAIEKETFVLHSDPVLTDSHALQAELSGYYRRFFEYVFNSSKFNEEKLHILELYFSDFSYKEISQKLGIRIGTAKTRVCRAKKELEALAESYLNRDEIIYFLRSLDDDPNEQALQAANSKKNLPKT